MANPNGKKGSSFERSIANAIYDQGWPYADRRVKTGSKDKGDIAGFTTRDCHRIVLECKNVRTMNLGGWVGEAETERVNDDAIAGFVVHKRRGKADPLDQYVTGTLRDLIAILTDVRPD